MANAMVEGLAHTDCDHGNCDACVVMHEAQQRSEMPLERDSEMQHVASAVLRRGKAQANQYGADLVVITIERDPRTGSMAAVPVVPPDVAILESLPDPKYAFGYASTSDDSETVALALRAIASRLERG